jgi:glucose/arabinose dehydrogenase
MDSASSGHGGHGPYGNAQNPSNLLGSILRIDPEPDAVAGTPYTIPPDNPFKETPRLYGDTGLVYFKEEIWAYGLRNPWRFSFDDTGRLWAADVGQNIFEEINIIEKGGNYGWRVIEGYHNYEEDQAIIDQIALDLQYANTNEFLNDLKMPIHEYSHWTGISILGGFVYRGSPLTALGVIEKYAVIPCGSSSRENMCPEVPPQFALQSPNIYLPVIPVNREPRYTNPPKILIPVQ